MYFYLLIISLLNYFYKWMLIKHLIERTKISLETFSKSETVMLVVCLITMLGYVN